MFLQRSERQVYPRRDSLSRTSQRSRFPQKHSEWGSAPNHGTSDEAGTHDMFNDTTGSSLEPAQFHTERGLVHVNSRTVLTIRSLLSVLALLTAAAASAQTPPPGAPRIPGQNPNGMRIFLWTGLKTHAPGQHDYPQFLADWSKTLTGAGA